MEMINLLQLLTYTVYLQICNSDVPEVLMHARLLCAFYKVAEMFTEVAHDVITGIKRVSGVKFTNAQRYSRNHAQIGFLGHPMGHQRQYMHFI